MQSINKTVTAFQEKANNKIQSKAQTYNQLLIQMIMAYSLEDGFRDAFKANLDTAENHLAKHNPDTIIGKAGQQFDLVGVVLTIGIAAIVSYVIIFAGSETEAAIDVDSGSAFDNATNSTTEGLESAMSILVVVFIVLILVVAVGALTLLRRR